MEEFICQLIEWQREKPSRSVDITVDRDGKRFWVYDYALETGKHLDVGDPMPTDEVFLIEKRQALIEELEGMT